MIDVIIPAYNSHKTIIRTLASIVMQLNREELKVTIVNDRRRELSRYYRYLFTFNRCERNRL